MILEKDIWSWSWTKKNQ